MANVNNFRIGACSVTFNGTDLGHTNGGVEISYEPTFQPLNADLYGETPVDQVLMGEKFTAKCMLAEYTIANLGVAIPQGVFAGAANARRTFGAKAGKSSKTDAAQLVLHPLNSGTREHDIVIHLATVTSTITINHTNDAQRMIEVTFEAFIDETKTDGNYLGFIGDSTA